MKPVDRPDTEGTGDTGDTEGTGGKGAPATPETAATDAAVTRVACPQCLGNRKRMDFKPGDRATGEAAGWRAVDCPECGGRGEVPEADVPAIEGRIRQRIEAARTAEADRR